MTVKELKKALEGVDESLPVYVTADFDTPPKETDSLLFDWFYTTKASYSRECSIGNASFDIYITEGFSF